MSQRNKILTDMCSHFTTECKNDYVKTISLYLNFNSVLLPEQCKECFIITGCCSTRQSLDPTVYRDEM